jgi:hypothetical protein
VEVWKSGSLEVDFSAVIGQWSSIIEKNRQLPTANCQPPTANRQPCLPQAGVNHLISKHISAKISHNTNRFHW